MEKRDGGKGMEVNVAFEIVDRHRNCRQDGEAHEGSGCWPELIFEIDSAFAKEKREAEARGMERAANIPAVPTLIRGIIRAEASRLRAEEKKGKGVGDGL